MSWFTNNKEDRQNEIDRLEREYNHLENEIRYANKKWWECRFVDGNKEESDYWNRLEDKYINKQYRLREKIRNLERQL